MSTASAVVPIGYKQTEVGVIPEDWNISKLGDIISYTKGFAFRSNDYRKYGTRIIQVSDTDANGIHDNNAVYIDTNNSHIYSKWRLKYGDIVVSTVGSKPPMYDSLVAKSTFIPEKYDGSLLNQNAVILRAKSGMLDQQIILHSIFQSKRYLTHIEKIYRGNANQASITLTELFDFLIIMPTDSLEIESVSNALVDSDSKIQALEHFIAKRRDIKQGTMQELLTGKARLPGFTDDWETATLGQIEKKGFVKLFRGNVISKKDINQTPGEYPIYSSSVISNGIFGSYGKFMFDEELITWSIDGGGHFFYRSKHRFSVTNVCGYMRVISPSLSCRFLAYCLQQLHSRKVFDYTKKAHPSVIRNEYSLSLPPIEEQKAIAEVLSDMDAEITALEERLEKAKAIKQGMMQQLLTGKIRLVEPQTSQEVNA